MPQSSLLRPPRIAAWLVDLVTPSDQTESIPGDLLEEFSELASKSGVASARRWYWRQSLKTTAHLIFTGLRVAPWSIAGVVLIGLLLRRFGAELPEKAIVALLRTQRPYSNAHVEAYMAFLTWGMPIARLVESMIIGCIVAVGAKGREMTATLTLCLVFAALTGLRLLLLARHLPETAYLMPFLLGQFAGSFMIAVGGVIIRASRSAIARRHSGS